MSPLPYEVTLISADVRKTLTVIALNSSLAMITALNTFPQVSGPCAIKCTPGCKLADDEVRAV